MAKKQPAKKGTPGKASDKTAFQIRLDNEVHEKVKAVCDAAGISLNQFISGLVRWAGERAMPGEAYRDEAGAVSVRRQAGCVSIGELSQEFEDHEQGRCLYKGKIDLILDFTERRVIRDAEE